MTVLRRMAELYRMGGTDELTRGIRDTIGYQIAATDEASRRRFSDHKKHLDDTEGLVVAEIGVWYGDHAMVLLDRWDVNSLYLIDPYEVTPEWAETPSELVDMDIEAAKQSAIERFGDDPRCIQLFERSTEVELDDVEFDYIYIDAVHSFRSVLSDLEAWYPRLKPGGILAGHDSDWPGVLSAASVFAASCGHSIRAEQRTSEWWFRRPLFPYAATDTPADGGGSD